MLCLFYSVKKLTWYGTFITAMYEISDKGHIYIKIHNFKSDKGV